MKQNHTFFDRTILKSDPISLFLKIYSSISITFKIEIAQFYDESEPNKIFQLLLEYFNDFQN